MIKKGILTLFVSVVAITWSLAQVNVEDIVWDKKVHDFGELEFGAKKFTVAFTFTNYGSGDFRITMANTSCNCTDVKWPETIIKPGGKGVVTAIFNPQGLSGDIDKQIEVFANFKNGNSVILHIQGKIDAPELPEVSRDTTFYPGQFGYLRLSQYSLFFGSIPNNTSATHSFLVVNDFNKPLSLGIIEPSEPYITFAISSPEVKPGDTVQVNVTIDASKVNDFGELKEELVLRTRDLFYPIKSVELYFNVEYAFEDSKRAKRRAPKAVVSQKQIDMGEMNEGGKKKGTFTIANAGKTDLQILKIKTDCSCTMIENYPTVIKKGEQAELTVEFDALFKHGRQGKQILIYTNDPMNPVIELVVTAMVNEYK